MCTSNHIFWIMTKKYLCPKSKVSQLYVIQIYKCIYVLCIKTLMFMQKKSPGQFYIFIRAMALVQGAPKCFLFKSSTQYLGSITDHVIQVSRENLGLHWVRGKSAYFFLQTSFNVVHESMNPGVQINTHYHNKISYGIVSTYQHNTTCINHSTM